MTVKSRLQISDELSLPLEFTTRTQAIIAKKGAGKTNTAVVQAEELLSSHQQVVIVDPTGAWWGLKSSADGKKEGFSVSIFGGEHADVPLEEMAGEVVADAIVDQGFSAIIDLSLFRKGAMHRFMASFLETLYRRNRQAMHLFIDEADMVAPQKPFGEEARTLGAMQDIVRRGRLRGIGCTMITQRPQVLNKDVLTQADLLTTLRLTHPKDINAIKEWVEVHGDPKQAKDMIISLPSLPTGMAWLWDPDLNIFQKVQIRRRNTFDSSATPKAGEKAISPKVIAQVDLQKLGDQIAATIQRQKENDPKELKRKVAELQKKLDEQVPVVPEPERVEVQVPIISDEQAKMFIDARIELESICRDVLDAIAKISKPAVSKPVYELPPAREKHVPSAAKVEFRPNRDVNPNGKLNKVCRSILTVLAQCGPSNRSKIAIIAGYAPKAGGFSNGMSDCRTAGWIEGSNPLTITHEGREILGSVPRLLSGESLFQYWQNKLPKAEREIITALRFANRELTREEIGGLTGYAPSGGGFSNALSRLRTMELIEGFGTIRLCEELRK